MKTLVTGATGFIGRRLLQPGDTALTRAVTSPHDTVVGDLLNPTSLAVACNGIDTIFHCAGYAHAFTSSDPDTHWRINFEGTRNLLMAAGNSGVKRFVFLSSVKAMAEPGDECADEDWPGEPITPYGRAKRAAEDAVLEAGAKFSMHVVNLRLPMVYGRGGRGNLERMVAGIRSGWFPPLPETGNRRSIVHVDDVVAALRLVVEAPAANGRTYIVASPNSYSGRDIYDALSRAISVVPTYKWSVPAVVLRTGGCMGDVLGRLINRPLLLNSESVSRLLDSACYSPARIARELGWRADVELKEGIREMLGDEALS